MKPLITIVAMLLMGISAVHLVKIIFQVDILVNGMQVPIWLSIFGFIIPLVLALMLWRDEQEGIYQNPALADENNKKRKRKTNNMTSQSTPHIDHTGDIIIPFNADSKYHFGNVGQPLPDIRMELNAPEDIWGKHTEKPYSGNTA